MSERFVASNGRKIDIPRSGEFELVGSRPDHVSFWLSPGQVVALREFFQYERDKELGRWRSPENPNYVVYEDRARCYISQPAVIVINELDGATAMCGRGGLYSASGIGALDKGCEPAASAYFTAREQSMPWVGAGPNEVWLLTIDGERVTAVTAGRSSERCNEAEFWVWDEDENMTYIDRKSVLITEGRRLYPVVSDAE